MDFSALSAPNRLQFNRNSVTPVISHALLLLGAMMVAVQMRLQVPLGADLPGDYQPQPLLLYPLLLVVALVSGLAAQSSFARRPRLAVFLAPSHPFRQFWVTLGLALLAVLVLLPGIGKLQVAYFTCTGILLGAFCIALPYRLYLTRPGSDVGEQIRLIWQRRALLMIWLRFNIQTRYAQRILGFLWIILLPLATSIVLSIAFSQIMRVQMNVPFLSFYMAGLVPYNLFSNDVMNSTGSITNRIGIITQVYFPREILVLLTLGEGIIDFFFAGIALILINLLLGVYPNVYFVLLPFLFVLLLVISLGLMFLVSSLNVIIRDMPQLLSIVMQLLFFLTPIIYPVEQLPEKIRFLFVINPIAPIIQGFRDIIVYARPPDLLTFYYPVVFAVVALVVGYATFKSIESEMADFL